VHICTENHNFKSNKSYNNDRWNNVYTDLHAPMGLWDLVSTLELNSQYFRY
jgi:hypothetical protein